MYRKATERLVTALMGHMLQKELRKPKWGAGPQRQGKEKAKIIMTLVKAERRQEGDGEKRKWPFWSLYRPATCL